MKTCVVISDSHGNVRAVEKLRNLFEENDYIFHLGDGAVDMGGIYRDYPDKTFVCLGNCDSWGGNMAKNEWEVEIEGHKVFACHGHMYRVKYTLSEIAKEAKARGADVVLYGHTHTPSVDEIDGVTIINPGTLSSRSAERTYAYLVFTRDKVVSTIVNF